MNNSMLKTINLKFNCSKLQNVTSKNKITQFSAKKILYKTKGINKEEKIMPDISTKVSAWTFQQCDGTNFSTAGIEAGVNIGKGSLGGYAGVGTSFTEGSTGAVIDVKGSMPYGNSAFSGGFRVRHNLNPNSQSVQFRVQPCTVTIPITDKTSIYTTPYVATKVTYGKSGADTTVGNFTGISTKIGKASVFVEGQIYDVSKIDPSTTSVNVGVSIPL